MYEGDYSGERQEDLWSALDGAAYSLASHIDFAEKNGDSIPCTAARELERVRIIAFEGLPHAEAGRLAARRVGIEHDQVCRWARDFVQGFQESRGRDWFLRANARALAETWATRKGAYIRTDEEAEDAIDELWEILDRASDDPERRELLEFVPGSEDELRDVLSRR